METGRTENSVKNTAVSVISRLTAIFMGYVLRVVFTHKLSSSYVGINGLFLEIINVLSLSEMGVGTAITFALYRPIAERDLEKQKSLMHMFGRFYQLVAVLISVAGVVIFPFLDVMIKTDEPVEQLEYIYVLYMANTVLSYLFVYKKILIDAHQKLYIGVFYQTMFWILQDVLQIIILIWKQDFILFLWINIVTTIMSNLCISWKADRLYPYLREKDTRPLSKEERTDIFRNIRAMLIHKTGNVMINHTDNILLSSFVGLFSAGCYSNYYLIIGSIRQVMSQVYAGITASVGNLGATTDRRYIRNVFETVFFTGQWLYGFSAICLYELLSPFVEISFGKQYVFSQDIVLILCINFYLNGVRNAALTFRDSLGLFWYDRYKAIAEAVLNLVSSIVLVQFLGTPGVFMGTLVSMAATSLWIEPYVLYKYGFGDSCGGYFVKFSKYLAAFAAIWKLTDVVCHMAEGEMGMVLLLRSFICIVLPNLCYLVLFHRKAEYLFLKHKLKLLLQKKGWLL